MNKTFFLPLIIIFFTLYYFLFPEHNSSELVWTAAYSEALVDLKSSDSPLTEAVIFNQGDQKAAIGIGAGGIYLPESGYRGSLSSSHLFYNSDGALYLEEFGALPSAVTRTAGTAIVLDGRYFSIDYSAASIEEFDTSGRSLWSWRGLAPVTALAWNDEYIAVGSLDGTVHLIYKNGTIAEYFAESSNGDNVVYGIALSGDSSRISIVSGLRNQILRTYTVADSPQLIRQVELKSHFRRPVKMYYSYDASFLWVEQDKGVLQIAENTSPFLLPVEGSFLMLTHDSEGQLIYILSREDDGNNDIIYALKGLSPEGNLLFESKTGYMPYSIQLSGSDLVFSMNHNLTLLNRENL